MAKKRLVVGNWKMYIEKPEEARQFALTLRRKVRGLSGVDVYVAPPFPFIADVAKVLESSPVRVGAQTCSPYTDGQHTGEITAAMIKNVGGLFSIVGHSERRQEGDTNEIVRIELERAIAANLTPILCIGEEERKKDGEHFAIIEEQLSTAIKDLPKNMLRKLIVAYEPVWAIGKSAERPITPVDLQEMTIFIRKTLSELMDRKEALRIPVLYGGSVDPENADELLEGGVNGFLVGRASAQVDSFIEIIQSVR